MRIFFPEFNIRLYDKNYLTGVFLTVIILTHGPMATSLLYLNQKILLTPMIIGRITITSSLGKVFNNVLNTRLDSFLTEHNLIHPSQVGFTKHAMVYFTFRNMFCRSRDLEFPHPQNSTLGYMTKTLNEIIFFSSTKIRIFFRQHWESEYCV